MYSIRQITRYEYSWLRSEDFHNLYSQLTTSTLLERNEFEKWFKEVLNNPCFKLFGVIYSNSVGSDLYGKWVNQNCKLIGLASLWLHPRYYRKFGTSAHLEDLVIDKSYNNLGLGKKLINEIINWCKERNYYKIQLNCDSKLENYYKLSNFENNGVTMNIYFENLGKIEHH